MHWNTPAPSSVRRTPKYISPSAQSVSVTVNQGVPQVLNFPGTTLTLNAPVGTDLFVFQTYDEANGQGNVLGRAAISQAIIDGAANTVAAVLDGVIASLAITLGNPTPNAGTAAMIPISASGRDADGNVIVGSSDYAAPILLSITDPANTGTLSLSAGSMQSPAGTATLNYNGGTLVSASVVASTTGVPSASTAITPTPTFYSFSIPTSSSGPDWITLGPDGNMWFTEETAGKIGRITPAGIVNDFAIPTAASGPSGIISGSDGRLWFCEYSASKIGAMTTSGTFAEYPTAFAGDGPGLLVDRGDGTIWYTGYGGDHISVQPINGSAAYGVSVPTANAAPYGITTAVDNNIYFTEQDGNNIGHLPNTGTVPVEVPLLSPASYPEQIIRGPERQRLVYRFRDEHDRAAFAARPRGDCILLDADCEQSSCRHRPRRRRRAMVHRERARQDWSCHSRRGYDRIQFAGHRSRCQGHRRSAERVAVVHGNNSQQNR